MQIRHTFSPGIWKFFAAPFDAITSIVHQWLAGLNARLRLKGQLAYRSPQSLCQSMACYQAGAASPALDHRNGTAADSRLLG